MNEIKKLNINTVLVRGLAKMRVSQIDTENKSERLFAVFSENIEPKIIYKIEKNIIKEKNKLTVEEAEFKSKEIEVIADEIVDSVIFYTISIGDIEKIRQKAQGIFDEAMIDIIGTAYIDALRDYFRMSFEDNYMLGANFTPGITLDIEDIDKIYEILNLKEEKIEISDYKVVLPQKTVLGFYMTYAENHPAKRGNCETCMARGYGCNLCYEAENNV